MSAPAPSAPMTPFASKMPEQEANEEVQCLQELISLVTAELYDIDLPPMAECKEDLIDEIGDASSQLETALNRYRALTLAAIATARGSGHAAISGCAMLQQKVPGTLFSPLTPGMTTLTVERISLGSLRQSLRITVALSLILVLFSVGYGVPISQYVSMYSLIYYEQRSLRDRSTTR